MDINPNNSLGPTDTTGFDLTPASAKPRPRRTMLCAAAMIVGLSVAGSATAAIAAASDDAATVVVASPTSGRVLLTTPRPGGETAGDTASDSTDGGSMSSGCFVVQGPTDGAVMQAREIEADAVTSGFLSGGMITHRGPMTEEALEEDISGVMSDMIFDEGGVVVSEGEIADCGMADPTVMNAEQDELAAFLKARGVAFEMITEGDFRFVQVDHEDATANEAVADFYWEKYPMPQDVIDQINDEADELAEFLRGKGIAVTVTTDRHGVKSAEIDYEDEATIAAINEFWEEKYPA